MQTFYFLYKITNTVNNKIYLGKHKTKNLDDGYFGSGKLLKRAIAKYGKENFFFEVLKQFNSEEELNQAEKELITEEFCQRDDNYNLCVGGKGGFSYINRAGLNIPHPENFTAEHRTYYGKLHQKKYLSKYTVKGKPATRGRTGIPLSEKGRELISEKAKVNSKGEKNSQYGSMWITNGLLNKKQKALEQIPEGWYKGRTR